MKYSDQQILDFVYGNESWAVTEGCPCISALFDGNEIYVCLFQNDDCEDFIEIEVISTKRVEYVYGCLLYTSPSPRDKRQSRMPSSA